MMIEQLQIPRLQLVWRKPNAEEPELVSTDWICVYQLILPSGPHDIRSPVTVEMGKTRSVGAAKVKTEPPYRDGVRSLWDAKNLGGLPVYVIGSDGEARPHVVP